MKIAALVFISAFSSVVALGSTAQAADSSNANSDQSDKLDVSGLEQKYWSAKDTDFTVVQNRLFSKAHKFAFSVEYGETINDAWSNGPTLGLNLAYYFTERYGIEAVGNLTNASDNDATSNLKSQLGSPNNNQLKNFYGLQFDWVPFYAKMSVLNSSIIYFDMSISPGFGMTSYQQQIAEGNGTTKSTPTFSLDVAQNFFLLKWFSLRLDYINRWYSEDITQYTAPTSGRTNNTQTNHESLLMGGVTFYF